MKLMMFAHILFIFSLYLLPPSFILHDNQFLCGCVKWVLHRYITYDSNNWNSSLLRDRVFHSIREKKDFR